MFLHRFRRLSAPIAVVVTATFLSALLPVRSVEAADAIAPGRGTGGASSLAGPSPQAENANGLATVDLATGSARATLPFDLPRARGNAQPSLPLTYSSQAGVGYAGVGWTIDLPSIERKGVAGRPRYQNNRSPGNSEFAQDDRFLYNHRPLVPICTLDSGANCAHALAGERFPQKLAGWTYYRAEVDDGVRLFFAPTGETWLAQTKDGLELVFGKSFFVDGAPEALELADNTLMPAGASTKVHRWRLIEQTDASLNTVYYVWQFLQKSDYGRSLLFLTDIYDTAAPKRQGGFDPSTFAHHTHLRWSAPDATADAMSRTPIWRAQPTLRLLGVDVTSSPPSGSGPRELVRRYHLDYAWNTTQTRASLSSFQLEGRCNVVQVEGPTNELPALTGCKRQPATTLTYTQPKPVASPVSGPGFSSGSGNNIALLDIDGDALPEVLSFAPHGPPPNDKINVNVAGVRHGLDGYIYLQANAGRTATMADLAPGAKRAIYGDWLGDGRLNLLWLNINPQQYTQASNTYETYSFGSHSSFIGIGPTALDVDPTRPPVRLGQSDATSAQAIDIDGDGLVDLGFLDWSTRGSRAFLSQRKPTGGVYPFGERIDNVCTSVTKHQGIQAADFDGDGLADLISVQGGTTSGSTFGPPLLAHVYRGRGDGRFGTYGAAPTDCDLHQPSDEFLALSAVQITPDIFQSNLVAFHDVTGDGLADLIMVTHDLVYVGFHSRTPGSATKSDYFTTGRTFALSEFGLTTSRSRPFDPTTVSLLFGDTDASGTDELILGVGEFHHIVDFVGSTPSGLLQSVNNGVGATTTIEYDSVANATKASTAKLPLPAQVVTRTTTTNGLTGAQKQSYVASYTYEEPLYDARDRMFVGFNKVSVDRPGDADAPGVITTTTFVPSTCAVTPTQPCAGLVDYVYRAFRGLPAVVEQFDEGSRAHLTTFVSTFRYQNAYQGTDGRGVRQIWPAQSDLYQWNPSEHGTPTPIKVVIPNGEAGMTISVTVSVPDKGSHLRRARSLDYFGNETAAIDFGLVGIDTPIRVERDWYLVAGEASAWQYRSHDERVAYSDMQGGTLIAPVRKTHFAFEQRALLTQVSATLSGTLPLLRQNATSPFALPPADASADTNALITRSTIDYDPWGNVVSIKTPNGRCRAETYDPAFQQLPIASTLYTSGCGSANPLVTHRKHDRGFEVVTSELSPALGLTLTTYDVFGRVVEVDQPDTTVFSTTSALPALIVDYSDADHGGPVRKVFTQRILSGSGRDGYASTWEYIDAFGRTLATLRSSEVQNRWVVEGTTTRSASGRVIAAFESFFFQGVGTTFPVDQPVAQRSMRFTYDQLGRVLETFQLGGGTGSLRTYNASNLSVSILDAEQRPGGTHPGAVTTVSSDGHGRVKQAVRHVEKPSRDDIITTNTFLATGELDTAVQQHSANPADSVVRQLQYDSFGRLVQNSEPNSDLWRYAYNDAGDLVGTSDPRGCGENLSYDGLGRLVAEDYSPCANTQSAYSAPDPSNGEGYEALYRFDVPEVSVGFGDIAYVGRLAATLDRGQHTRIARDARGRAVGTQRRLAKPNPDNAALAVADRYAPNWFSRSISYDESDRPVSITTGADVAELQVHGASEVTTSFTPRGTIDTVSGSYGLLFTQDVAANGSLVRRVLGDVASTTSDYGYNANGSLATLQIHRRPGAATQGGAWLAPSSTYSPPDASDHTLEADLATYQFTYDLAGNPTKITDSSDSTAWRMGSFPVSTRSMKYDDSYRMTRTDVAYAGGDDRFVSPYAQEEGRGDATFPPLSPVSTGNRLRWQTTDYDWLGNIRTTDDDAHDFPDRSTGTVSLGQGPHQFYSSSSSGGSIKAQYDQAGNLTNLYVERTAGCTQNCVTNYLYYWDELGRLAVAGRMETRATSQQVVAIRSFVYDASGNRVTEQAVDPTSGTSTYNAAIFDSLRLDHATFPDANGDYEHTALTESVYLKAADGTPIAHVVHATSALPTGARGSQHVFFEIGDHLGSTSFVIDGDTGELVERPTYQAFGGVESDFRPDRWGDFREGHRYTDHEDDAEVGLVYFGQRYYAPILGRWVSPDPLNVHALASDPNPYAFVRGSPMAHVDPNGLDTSGCDNLSGKCDDYAGMDTGALVDAITDFWSARDGSGGSGGDRQGRYPAASPAPPPTPTVTTYAAPTPFRPLDQETGFSGWLARTEGGVGGWVAGQIRDDSTWRNLQVGFYGVSVVALGIASGGALWYLGGAGGLTGIGILGNTAPGGIGIGAGVGAAGTGAGVGVGAAAGVPAVAIQFGNNANQVYHAFRHIDAMGLDRGGVMAAIEAHLPTVASQLQPGQPLNQIITVNGQRIQYTAYILANGIVNVGRIHGVP